jgi:hypothetical protein
MPDVLLDGAGTDYETAPVYWPGFEPAPAPMPPAPEPVLTVKEWREKSNPNGNPWHDERGRFSGPGASGGAVTDREDSIRAAPIEHCCGFDQKGQLIAEATGNDHAVTFPEEVIAKMQETGVAVMTHNHPLQDDSFSPTDVAFATKLKVGELRVVTKAATYSMKPVGGHWPDPYQTSDQVFAEDHAVREEFWTKIHSGEMARDEASIAHWHTVWTRLAPKIGVIYTRTPVQ